MQEVLNTNKNFVKIVDIVKSNSFTYIIMDYCNGRNLEDLIESRGFLTEAEVHYIVKQIANAFLSIQDKGIVHRDLKPGNIMLHFENYPEVRLPDH